MANATTLTLPSAREDLNTNNGWEPYQEKYRIIYNDKADGWDVQIQDESVWDTIDSAATEAEAIQLAKADAEANLEELRKEVAKLKQRLARFEAHLNNA
ncbi:hypothetical protein [Rhabdochromatium marinum]|uniref:hypothetical protein n=1 Tax=Rhabdochromatium marinum TaxID=48729 RepID=UPI00190481F1|nr:hypothetical protein [Rhabdochromatium marinum]MBK1648488.1 hypothetical protein [Rhabdochromatium marinum]